MQRSSKRKPFNIRPISWMCVIIMLATILLAPPLSIHANTESTSPPADVVGHWARPVIEEWLALALAKGNPDGSFRPDAPISRAEFVTLVNRVFRFSDSPPSAFPDVSPTAWYAGDLTRAVNAGILKGDERGRLHPGAAISRQEAAVILSRAFRLPEGHCDATQRFTDAGDIASWAINAVGILAAKGHVAGRPGNRFAPRESISRAETVKMIDNVMGSIQNKPGRVSVNAKGNFVVNTGGVTLHDTRIEGDLYLTQGIGDGEVTLDGVVVMGRTFIEGGGENSIIITNSLLTQEVMVLKADGRIRIVARGDTTVGRMIMNSGASLEEEDVTAEGFTDRKSVV